MNENRYLIGSYLLGLRNNHDRDMLVLDFENEDPNFYRRECVDGDDVVIYSVANLNQQINMKLPLSHITAKRYIINYQLDKSIIGQDFPIEYHILDRRSDYIDLLNWIVDNQAANFKKIPELNDGNCSKIIYHIAYTLFIVENNSTTLTAEQKAIVQKIHDRQMPQDYLDVLAEKIRNLK